MEQKILQQRSRSSTVRLKRGYKIPTRNISAEKISIEESFNLKWDI
jgi:hypothetical protein